MLILVIGGAASGKSAAAESLAAKLPAPVTYVATLVPDESDADLMRRIDAHRRRRPSSWRTLDATTNLAGQLRQLTGTVLVDSLGAWVARRPPEAADVDALMDAFATRAGDTVVVTDEVGMSVHPPTAAGREFRDAIGAVNQRVAAVADRTVAVVAGRAVLTAPVDAAAIIDGAT
jgi:nicotinate-nucleotide--dimethylbenzimidazole phosphoribosyltransferase